MISGIIKVSVSVISLSLRLRLITLTSTLIIPDITKTSSNNCLKFIASVGYNFCYQWCFAINYFLHILIFNNPWIHHFHIDHNALFLRPLPPPSICIIILSNFFKVLRSYQEKSKTMVMQNFGGKTTCTNPIFSSFPVSSFPIFDQNSPLTIRLPSWYHACKKEADVFDHLRFFSVLTESAS